jgi:hypothetical protein
MRCFLQVAGSKSLRTQPLTITLAYPGYLTNRPTQLFLVLPWAGSCNEAGLSRNCSGRGCHRRRTPNFRLPAPELSISPPNMVVLFSGLDVGLSMVLCTAATLLRGDKALAHTSSVDSIPSCDNQEDHGSIRANAAPHAPEIANNVGHSIAVKLRIEAQALGLRTRGPDHFGRVSAAVYALFKERLRSSRVAGILPRYRDTRRALVESRTMVHYPQMDTGGHLS